MYRNRQFSIFPIGVCITDQFDKYEGHKQGRKKIKSAVLIRSDAEVCTFFFSWQRQVDLIIGSDLADQLILEHLKSGTESDDDTGTYRVTCLLIDAVGDFCRMGDRKQVKEAVQFFFRTHGQEFVYLSDILCLRWESLIHIENQSF